MREIIDDSQPMCGRCQVRLNAASSHGQIAELSASPLVTRLIDLVQLDRAIKNWPTGGRHTTEIFQEYNLALTRGVSGGWFLRWFESAN